MIDVVENRVAGLHIIGGFGEASHRLMKAIYDGGLCDRFRVKAIVDVYPEEMVRGNPMDVLSKAEKRMRGGMHNWVEESLYRGFSDGSITYYTVDNKDPHKLSKAFLKEVSDFDLVDISSPNTGHVPLLIQTMGSRKNTLIEKPLATSETDLNNLESFLEGHWHGEGDFMVKDVEHYSHYPNVKHYVENFKCFRDGDREIPALGKVTGIELHIEEDERFESQRNRDTINIKKSGGGIWLDMGIHAMAFLRSIGANTDTVSAYAQSFRFQDPAIAGCEYGETSMLVRVRIKEGEYFSKNCSARISVGKAMAEQRKEFIIHHEHGTAVLNMKEKRLTIKHGDKIVYDERFNENPFSIVLQDSLKCIFESKMPITPLRDAMLNVKDVLNIYKASGTRRPFLTFGYRNG